jgi:3-hydroxyisobutyrate dehydrogenase
MTTETKEPVGIVGAGRMGLAMLKHLVAAGYPVIACDMSETQRNLARQSGAEIAATPAELGSLAAFVIIGVGFDEEARAVIEGEDGLLTAMQPGGVIAVCSTVSPATVRALGAKASEKGIGTLDAPICRGRWAADAGELLALLGGTDEVVERSRPIFSTFCSDIAHLGEIGHGQVAKTMNNLLLWVNGVALIEAGRLAETTGIDLIKLREALLISSGNSAALEDWDMISFTWALKDMQIVAEIADEAKLSMPVAGAIRELVKDARRIKASSPPAWTGKTPAR